MRKCPFTGCTKTLEDSVFACGKHWFGLTAAQKAAVWSAYRDYMADKIDVDELRRVQQSVLDATKIGGTA